MSSMKINMQRHFFLSKFASFHTISYLCNISLAEAAQAAERGKLYIGKAFT